MLKPPFVLRFICTALMSSTLVLAGCNSKSTDVSAAASTSAEPMSPPQTMNATFQARNPRTCTAIKHKPGAAEAAALVQCDLESVSAHTLYLVSDVSVQIGSGRPYNTRMDTHFPNADTTGTIYPIRGSFKSYTCDTPSQITPSKDTCSITVNQHPEGACWKTTFGDWQCHLQVSEFPAAVQGPPPATY